MEGSYSGLASAATGVVPPALVGHRDKILYPADAAKAQALLEEAGVSGLTVELAAQNDKTSQLTCQIIQALLGAVGITVDIKNSMTVSTGRSATRTARPGRRSNWC
jgi:peptide/nickel transport system substrate-binding protein